MEGEPTQEEISEKLIELSYVWGDVEETLLTKVDLHSDGPQAFEWRNMAKAVAWAFRVEAHLMWDDWGNPMTVYVLLYDVTDAGARRAAKALSSYPRAFVDLIFSEARCWGERGYEVRTVTPGTPVKGEICRRRGQTHPGSREPTLEDLPDEKEPEAKLGYVKRDRFWLTPIEAKFYDAVRETGLTFAVQPWLQGVDKRYRSDFIFFYDGGAVAVELDGHEYHKSKERRGYDAAKDRWLTARGFKTVRYTGTQVHADAQGCVSELLNVLRTAPARP